MKHRNIIIAAVAALLLFGAGLFFLWDSLLGGAPQEVSMSKPVDVVLDFYEPWLDASKATSTSPYKEGFADSLILSKDLRKQIKAGEKKTENEPDPVLCQLSTPPGISARLVSQSETEAQVVVLSTQKDMTAQSIATLVALNGGWYIDDITCTLGEFAPEREFSFEHEGFLLKSVPPPYNPANWHIVFEENGQQGHVAPIFFDAASMCTDLKGTSAVCVPDELVQTTKVHIQGQMSEYGVQVKNLKQVKE